MNGCSISRCRKCCCRLGTTVTVLTMLSIGYFYISIFSDGPVKQRKSRNNRPCIVFSCFHAAWQLEWRFFKILKFKYRRMCYYWKKEEMMCNCNKHCVANPSSRTGFITFFVYCVLTIYSNRLYDRLLFYYVSRNSYKGVSELRLQDHVAFY